MMVMSKAWRTPLSNQRDTTLVLVPPIQATPRSDVLSENHKRESVCSPPLAQFKPARELQVVSTRAIISVVLGPPAGILVPSFARLPFVSFRNSLRKNAGIPSCAAHDPPSWCCVDVFRLGDGCHRQSSRGKKCMSRCSVLRVT